MSSSTQLSARTFCTFAGEFSPFYGQGLFIGKALDHGYCFGRVLERPARSGSPGRRLQDARACGPCGFRERTAAGGHAAVSSDGHVSHDADRFASARARRETDAPDNRSAGTVFPVRCENSADVG